MTKPAKTLQQPESGRLEFKAKLSTSVELANTLISFANDAGGKLYLDIPDNPRETVGVEKTN
ncbi:MAG: hypothetical protein IEMM0006_0897 [bacterium]|nr:MAG: hypothetical protein IEMM0006_0897 [bacterium]